MNYPAQPPQPKKGVSTLSIVLTVIGIVCVLGLGTCLVGGYFVSKKVAEVKDMVGDGGMMLVSPPEVTSSLATDRKGYVGAWRSVSGKSMLDIAPTGTIAYSKAETAMKENINGLAIASFDGNDIIVKMGLTIRIKVSEPPHQVAGKWAMVADGIPFVRD